MAIEINAYNDFDAYSRNVRFIDGRMLLKDPKRQIWTNRHIELYGVHIQIGSLGSGNIVEGTSSPDGCLAYLPLTKSHDHVANGIVLDEHSVLVLQPNSDFCLSVRGPHEGCSIFIPRQKLARYGGHQYLPSVDEKPWCRIVCVTPQLAGRARTFIRETESAAATNSKFEFTPSAKMAATEAVRIVHSIMVEGQCVVPERDGRPRISRQEIVRRCKELLEERGHGPTKVGELASRAGVSERTLQTAFKEYFGVGPVGYLQLCHLRQINIALQAAQPDLDTVAKVLSRNGEWHFGRFAERYRRLFGELPSQTLSRQGR